MKIHAEVFFVKLEKEKVYFFKKLIDVSEEVNNPDIFVRKLVEDLSTELEAEKNKVIIHSTSWRCSHCGQIALTYMVYSDFFRFPNSTSEVLLKDLKIKSSGKKNQPTPHNITDKDIVSHALRHVSFLVKNDPDQYKGALQNEDISKFKMVDDALAGAISKGGDA